MLREFNKIIDPLYGPISIDPLLLKLIYQPEVQRLREIRLSNINSFLITGTSNISRFEHSLGTSYLAQLLSNKLKLNKRDSYSFMCAALLHDISITPFGHLMEESFRYEGIPFDHEEKLYEIIMGNDSDIGNQDFQIFSGKSIGFRKVLNLKYYRDLKISIDEIFGYIKGNGILGPLLNGTIDIDNIDNVCRMAMHLGLNFRKELPLEIVANFSIKNNEIYFSNNKSHLLKEWLDIRERLYNVLMTNPIDFASKSMLIEAIRIGLRGNGKIRPALSKSDWKLTDSELINRLKDYQLTSELIKKFQCGDFYNFICMYWINSKNYLPKVFDHQKIDKIRNDLAKEVNMKYDDVLIYIIKDKRYRQLKTIHLLNENEKGDTFSIENNEVNASNILLGITSKIEDSKEEHYLQIFKNKLMEIFQTDEIFECNPTSHIEKAFSKEAQVKDINQAQLF
jgi:HD superfamily phosphohydrolase